MSSEWHRFYSLRLGGALQSSHEFGTRSAAHRSKMLAAGDLGFAAVGLESNSDSACGKPSTMTRVIGGGVLKTALARRCLAGAGGASGERGGGHDVARSEARREHEAASDNGRSSAAWRVGVRQLLLGGRRRFRTTPTNFWNAFL